MYAVMLFPIGYNIIRMAAKLASPEPYAKARRRTVPRIVWSCSALIMLGDILLSVFGQKAPGLVMSSVLFCLQACSYGLWHLWHQPDVDCCACVPLVGICMVVGLAFRESDFRENEGWSAVCRTQEQRESWFQGHAAWHVLTAASVLLQYLFNRSTQDLVD
mmetsp:Transcript_15170/g.34430  ORF Transcript_15170/g.34430 Transcript_15170/m.34430 type:complete len:161 (-) Transcript_15170:193-675(-)